MDTYKVYTFDEFFESGLEESISPFLETKSKKWAKNLSLKTAVFSLILLIFCYVIQFSNININYGYIIVSFIYLFLGVPAILNALEDLKNFEINISVLMTLAAFFAILLKSPFEGALLLILFSLSDSLEKTISYKTKSAIYNLNKIAPNRAFVLKDDGTLIQKSIKDIKTKDKILIKAGETIPLDGLVIEGQSSINQVHLTGESMPVSKKVGDDVYAGGINIDGSLTIEITKISADSTISRIIKLITQAQEAKPKIQRWLDVFGKYYSTIVIVLSFIFIFILPFIFKITYFGIEGSIYRSIAFLIASSPCALIIGAPLAYLTSISACAKKGIILKGGFILDALKKCKNIAFDKTGTLTTGDLILTTFDQVDLDKDSKSGSFDKNKAIAIVNALEKKSTHPIAKAIHDYAKKNKINLDVKILDFKSDAGLGIKSSCEIDNKKYSVFIGRLEYIQKQLKISDEILKDLIPKEAKTISYLLIDKYLFTLTFSDNIRENISSLIENLKKKKNLVMLTGDNLLNANFVANKLGIDQVFANLSVEDKLNQVNKLAKDGLVMVGDGINDAPSLTRATVGISLAKIGSATAIDASDIILMNDDITQISYLFKKSNATSIIAKQNLIFAILIILFASIPSLLGLIPLWLAVCLHEGGTLLVGLNCLRLIRH